MLTDSLKIRNELAKANILKAVELLNWLPDNTDDGIEGKAICRDIIDSCKAVGAMWEEQH